MFIKVHNQGNDETVYATVRMCKAKYRALREFMHMTSQDEDVAFPYGTRLVKMGYGWYRVIANRDVRGSDKVNNAVKILRVFNRQYNDELKKEIIRLTSMQETGTQAVSYINGEYVLVCKRDPHQFVRKQERRPASSQQLAMLASKFGKQVQQQ